MYGALIGDCIGSFWESTGNKNPDIPLWMPSSRFTDDSVCTSAIAAWLVDGKDLTQQLQNRGRANFNAGFGGIMLSWILSNHPRPYKSWGNGSAMRVSPVALWAANDEELLALAEASAAPTHNSEQGIRGAQAAAWATRKAFEGMAGTMILEQAQEKFKYANLTTLDPILERPGHVFDVTCEGTVPLAMAIAVRSGSFDEAMKLCCSMGGDADTLGAIAGPLCEAIYGIPQQHFDNAQERFHKEDDIWEAVERLYAHADVKARLKLWGREGGTLIGATSGENVKPQTEAERLGVFVG